MSITSTLGDPLSSAIGLAAGSLATASLDVFGAWVLAGTKAALQEVAQIIGSTTAPNLESTWFSVTYWKVAGVATLLTVPFLFAAAVQAILRSDLSLLLRSVFAHLPLAMIAVTLAAPIVMLLLAATDQMSTLVSSAGASGGADFLDKAAVYAGTISSLNGSPFFALIVGLLTVAAALALTLELLVREAAVYVVVLMLPLAFAAFVWPARRIWAIRLVELLIALILAKFVIVAVLSLAGAALGQGGASISELLAAMALVLLSCFAPWALLRILPFTEIGAYAAGSLRQEAHRGAGLTASAFGAAGEGLAGNVSSLLHRRAEDAGQSETRWPADGIGPARHTDRAGGSPMTEATESPEWPFSASAQPPAPEAEAFPQASPGPAPDQRPTPSGPSAADKPSLADENPIWAAPNNTWPEWSFGADARGGPTEYQPPPAPEEPTADDPADEGGQG